MYSYDYFERLKKEKIILFGAGRYGKLWHRILIELGFNVFGFVDNNIDKHNSTIAGMKVYSIDYILPEIDKFAFVITIKNSNSCVKKQLNRMGVCDDRIVSINDLYESEWLRHVIDENLRKVNYLQFDDKLDKCDSNISIFYDAQIFSMQKWGGISRYFYEIVGGISKKQGARVTVLDGYNISKVQFDNNVFKPFSCCVNSGLTQDEYIRNAANKLISQDYCKAVDSIDIYHPTYYEDYELSNYKKKIITVADMIHELFGLQDGTIPNKKKMVEDSDGIIAVSESTKTDLINILGVPEDRVTVIYDGNSLNIDVSDEKRVVSDSYILYVGHRESYKNFICLLKAFSRSYMNHDLKLVCVGGGEFSKTELEMMENYNLLDRIEHLSGDDRMLANLYYNAEIFVYPSLYEGFGLPILEAMHYGTPVITSNVSSMPEIAGNSAELFDPNSEEELEYKISQLLNDSKRRNQLSKLGIEREKEFSWEKSVNETYEYYKYILGA